VHAASKGARQMHARLRLLTALTLVCAFNFNSTFAQTNSPNNPTWWDKYQYLKHNVPLGDSTTTTSVSFGGNIDISNECGPQSETFIAISPTASHILAAGSNEIFRLPMRGYFQTKGNAWSGVDLPLPPTQGANSINFGSDPGLAFDSRGNLFYSYIVVFFGNGAGVNATEMAVARSSDNGRTYPTVTYFSYAGGGDHFNYKPMITTDITTSRFRDSIYVAWDAATGGSTGGGVRFAFPRDHGATFTVTRADDPQGPGRAIGASPAVGPDGTVYVAWNDYGANTIAFNRSFSGGQTWDKQRVVAAKSIPFDIAIPAESFRGALVYPVLDVDRSNGPHRGRIYCSWMD